MGAVVGSVATGDAARAPDDVGGEFVAAELAVVLDEVADVLFEGVFLFFTEGGSCLCEVGELSPDFLGVCVLVIWKRASYCGARIAETFCE